MDTKEKMMGAARLTMARAIRKKIASAASTQESTSLKRCLSLRDLIGFGIGTTVGGGIFVAVGGAAYAAGPAVVISFLVAALSCFCTGLCYSEMALIVPSAGASYSFTYAAVGELAAYLVGVFNIGGNILSSAAVARGCAFYLSHLLERLGVKLPAAIFAIDVSGYTLSPMAMVLILGIGVINLRGTAATSRFNNFVTVVSLALLLAFVFVCMTAIDAARWQPFVPEGAGGVLQGSGAIFFAYLGFDVLACLSEEAEDPKVVPRGIAATLGISTVLYVAVAVVLTGLVTRDELDLAAPLAAAARTRGLSIMALAVSAAAVGNTLTTAFGGVLASPRICYVMAQDGLVPQSLAHTTAGGTPVYALMLAVVPTSVLAIFIDFHPLASIVSASCLCTFSLVCSSLIILRCPAATTSEAAAADTSTKNAPASNGCVAQPVASVLGKPAAGERTGTQDTEGIALDMEGSPHPAVTRSLLAFACFCFVSSASLRASHHATAWRSSLLLLLATIFFIASVCAAALVVRPFSRFGMNGSDGVASRESRADAMCPNRAFKLPFMPVLPLLGITINMAMLSMLPLIAILRCAALAATAAVVYVLHAAPRSRLNLGQKVPLKQAREDPCIPDPS